MPQCIRGGFSRIGFIHFLHKRSDSKSTINNRFPHGDLFAAIVEIEIHKFFGLRKVLMLCARY
jgi:hypothetical protein